MLYWFSSNIPSLNLGSTKCSDLYILALLKLYESPINEISNDCGSALFDIIDRLLKIF